MSTTMRESTATAPTVLSPAAVWDRVDPLCPDLDLQPRAEGLGSLPYQQLKGAGFERLCYELLLAEGFNPRFFGRSGQADYGVDIVVENGGTRTVYQCKNLAEPPTWTEIRDAIQKFEDDWLNQAELPKPDAYVYCCPQPLDDRSLGEKWTEFKDEWCKRMGVEVAFWSKRGLDSRLRGLPDIVAGLFSPSYAEHFCTCDDWFEDPWTRVQWGEARHASISRFLEKHQGNKICVSEEELETFRDLMARTSVGVFRGPPGSGKTLTGLELATCLTEPRRRIYYTTLNDSTDLHRLWRSVSRRKALPAVFVVDDCHLDLGQAGLFLERLGPELSKTHGNVRVLLMLRDVPSAAGEIDNTPAWLQELQEDGSVIDMSTSLDRIQEVTEHLRPNWIGLSKNRLEKLQSLTGGDLLLLDEILNVGDSPSLLDDLRSSVICDSLRKRYFEGNRRLPTILRLASLAQFEVAPRCTFLDDSWERVERELVAPLVTEVFVPPRHQFLHSSLAELIVRALLELEVGTVGLDEAVAETTATIFVDYLHQLAPSVGEAESVAEFRTCLERFLTGRLKLMEPSIEEQLKAGVLSEETVFEAIEQDLPDFSFSLLNRCLLALAKSDHPAKRRYVELVKKRFAHLLESDDAKPDMIGLQTIGTGFFTLSRNAPAELAAVQDKYGADRVFSLIMKNGTLYELFMVLQNSSSEFRDELLDELDEEHAGALVDQTISSGRSIGTLNLTLRSLGQESSELLSRLEDAVGAGAFLRLILENGTLFELFRILQYSSPELRDELLDELDEEHAGALVDQTISSGRSIGTLHLTLRSLGQESSELLSRLEDAIGARAFLRLILENGTLFELFRILQYSSPELREELLDELDEEQAGALVSQTISSGRSIGTLHLALQTLGQESPELLSRLEEAVGATAFLRLILENGTLFELFRILQYSSPELREELLDELDEEQAGALVSQTISSGRSIGTLPLAMRTLGQESPELLRRLEDALGAGTFLRLVLENGTLVELFGLLQYSSSDFREELLFKATEAMVSTLTAKAIAHQANIESIHYLLSTLARIPAQRSRLEQLMGTTGWWRLVIGVGTLNSLSRITHAMSEEARSGFLNASSRIGETEWRDIIARGLFLNACNFASKDLKVYPEDSQIAFCEALRQTAQTLAAEASWFDLNPSQPPDDGESDVGTILQEALKHRAENIALDDLVGLDFREAVNGFTFTWRERPDLRAELADRLWEILPEPEEWPREEGEIAALRFALTTARSELIAKQDAFRLLKETEAFLDAPTCRDIHTLPLFLLAWDMVALRYERGDGKSLEGILSDTLIDLFLTILEERVQPKGSNDEKLAQLMLAGLLKLLAPALRPRIRKILEPLAKSLPWLRSDALDSSFIPAFFALEGLSLRQTGKVFTPQVSFGLLAKANEYDDVGPAVEHVCELVREYGNF